MNSLLDQLRHHECEPPEDVFTLDPELIFDQAAAVDSAVLPMADGSEHLFVLFGRLARVPPPDGLSPGEDGKIWGREIVAYIADERGNIMNWESRYEETGIDLVSACNKLRFKLANGLAHLSNYEGSLSDIQL